MKEGISTILNKITLLNDAVLDSMTQENDKILIKNFTETGIKILGADFAFAWWKFSDKADYKLAYKSPATPYDPFVPRKEASHFTALKTRKPFFDSNVQKGKYGLSDISPFMKSFIILPISHGKHLYGSITLCYKRKHSFTEEELALSETIGSTTAQAITIHRLVENEQKKYKREQALKEVEASLRQERSKNEFIANAAHELRTPLAIIKGNVDLALRNPLKKHDSCEGVLHAINHEVKHLSGMLADLTLLTLEEEDLENTSSLEKVDLTALIATVVARCTVLAHKKHIALVLKKMPAVALSGNRVYLEKMLINLVKNSIIYGSLNGHTAIALKKTKTMAIITISDNGIGIAKKDLPHIFERFYRVTSAHTPGEEGTGLGLAIVKQAAEMHGGTVSVKSTTGKGTTFTVSFPVAG